MANPEDIRELVPGRIFRENDPTTIYWIREETVIYRHYPLRGTHIESFRFYLGSFAKDRKNCYCTSGRLRGGNGPTFHALNFAYATDERSVWTMGGQIKEADAESFVVCDDGSYDLGSGTRVPYGYGKDKHRVFYYDFDGKANWVRKADPQSFVSLNDGHFGKDDHFAFSGPAAIPKAKVEHWRKIGGFYSKDDARIYYFNRQIKDVDYDSFEFVSHDIVNLAKDKGNYYRNDSIISLAEFEKALRKDFS